jgi:hypothetical protein
VKIYVAAVEALRKNERQDETQFTTKSDDGFLSIKKPPSQPDGCTLLQVILIYLALCMTKLRVVVLCFSYFADNSIGWAVQSIKSGHLTQKHNLHPSF